MAEIVAVLVVPVAGDPGGLLASGRFPCWPPMASPHQTPIGTTWTATVTVAPVHAALVLWWDGALVPEGWDRARRVYYKFGYSQITEVIKRGPGTNPPLPFVEEVAGALVDVRLASRVIRLARVDGRLVEVTP